MGDLSIHRTKQETIDLLREQSRYMEICSKGAKTVRAKRELAAKADAYDHAANMVETIEEL
jgi:hypothetical protein